MTQTGTMSKLKIIPGRGLDGKGIKRRLANKTLEGKIFGPESYTLDQNMVEFTQMSRVEQIEAARNNSKAIKTLQDNMAKSIKEAQEKEQERILEARVAERLKEIANQTNPK